MVRPAPKHDCAEMVRADSSGLPAGPGAGPANAASARTTSNNPEGNSQHKLIGLSHLTVISESQVAGPRPRRVRRGKPGPAWGPRAAAGDRDSLSGPGPVIR